MQHSTPNITYTSAGIGSIGIALSPKAKKLAIFLAVLILLLIGTLLYRSSVITKPDPSTIPLEKSILSKGLRR